MRTSLTAAVVLALAALAAGAADKPAHPAPAARAQATPYVFELKLTYSGQTFEQQLLTEDGSQTNAETRVSDAFVMRLSALPEAGPNGSVHLAVDVELVDAHDKAALVSRQFSASVVPDAWTLVSVGPADKIRLRVSHPGEAGIPDVEPEKTPPQKT